MHFGLEGEHRAEVAPLPLLQPGLSVTVQEYSTAIDTYSFVRIVRPGGLWRLGKICYTVLFVSLTSDETTLASLLTARLMRHSGMPIV